MFDRNNETAKNKWLLAMYAVPLVCFLCTLTSILGDKPFFTRGEPREALVAQSILATGNWVLPFGYGGAVPSKPPMLHWLIALGSQISGEVTEFWCRFPSVFASGIFLLVFLLFLRKRVDSSVAVLSCAILASCIEWYRAAGACRVDMLLTVFTGLSLLGLYRWYEREYSGIPLLVVGTCIAAALTKGPIGIALPVGISGLMALLHGKLTARVFARHVVLALLSALGISIWYFLAFQERGAAFGAKVYYENIARLTSSMEDEPHNHPFWYLWGTLFLGFMPWALLILATVERKALAAVFQKLKSPITFLRQISPLSSFALLVAVAYLCFFSIPSSKRSVYLLPAYPFIGLLLAQVLHTALQQERKLFLVTSRFLGWLLCAAAIGMIGVVGFPAQYSEHELVQRIQQLFGDSRSMFLLQLFAVSGLLLVAWSRKQNVQRVFWAGAFLWMAALGLGDSVFTGRYAQALSPRGFAFQFNPPKGGEVLYSFRQEFYSLSFYLQQIMYRLEDSVPATGGIIFLFDSDIPELYKAYPQLRFKEISRSETDLIRFGRKLVVLEIENGV